MRLVESDTPIQNSRSASQSFNSQRPEEHVHCACHPSSYRIEAYTITNFWLHYLLATIKSLSARVLNHAEHNVRWALKTASSAELYHMSDIVVKGHADRRNVLAD